MGDNLLRQQIKNFKKRTDRAMDEMEQVKLFQRPEVFTTHYKANPISGHRFTVGETLYAIVLNGEEGVVLSRGHIRVGRIVGQGAEMLKESMRDLGSVLEVRVVSVSRSSSRATIEVLKR